MLANTQGLVGVLVLFVNQFGGKLSDSMGRKPFMMLGPVANTLIGILVYNNSANMPLVLTCRCFKQMFSSHAFLQCYFWWG